MDELLPTLKPTSVVSLTANTAYSSAALAYLANKYEYSPAAGAVIGALAYIGLSGGIYEQNMSTPALPLRNTLSGAVSKTLEGSVDQAFNTPGPALNIRPVNNHRPQLGDPAFDPSRHSINKRD
jgi:hypothetical protein